MSSVFNHLSKKKIHWNNIDKQIETIHDDSTIQVVCEDYICRKTDFTGFHQKFPILPFVEECAGNALSERKAG